MNQERDSSRHPKVELALWDTHRFLRIANKLAAVGLIGMTLSTATSINEGLRYDKQTIVQELPEDEIAWLFGHKELKTSRPERLEEYKDTSWVVLPGFNMSWRDSREIARTLQPYLNESGRVAWIGYADKGKPMDANKLTKLIVDYAQENDLDSINIDGQSVGGRITLDITQELSEKGLKVPNIILDSSPIVTSDAIDQNGLLLAKSWFMDLPITYYAAKSTNQFTEFNLAKNVVDIKNDIFADKNDEARLSSLTVKSQAEYIANMSLDSVRAIDIPEETRIFYLGSDDDRVVNTDQALEHLREAQPEKAKNIIGISTDGAGHADSRGKPKEYGIAYDTIATLIRPTPKAIRGQTPF